MTNQRGVILPLSLIILLILTSLVVSLLAVGVVEPQIAGNFVRGAQALNVAEAGAEHVLAQFVANPGPVQSACKPPPCGATQTLFTDQPLQTADAAVVGSYTVTYQPIGRCTGMIESTGRSSLGAALRTVRVVVTTCWYAEFSILADRVQVGGNAVTQGNFGSAHGNMSVSISGSGMVGQPDPNHVPPYPARGATTASSSPTDCNGCSDPSHVGSVAKSGYGKPFETIPTINPLDFLPDATIVLRDDHTILDVATNTVYNDSTNPGPFSGWNMQQPGNWVYSGGTTPPDGTYYASQSIRISSSPGSVATPWKATFVAGSSTGTGDVTIEGHPNIVANLDDALAVAGNSVTVRGTGGTANLTGALLADSSVTMNGAVSLQGHVVAHDAASQGSGDLTGNVIITYQKKTMSPLDRSLLVISWTQVPR